MIINNRIFFFPPILMIYSLGDGIIYNDGTLMFIQSVVILALVIAIVLKKREYGWLKYDEELDSMLSQSTLFVRRKTVFGLLSINAVKDLPWLIDKDKLKKLMEANNN